MIDKLHLTTDEIVERDSLLKLKDGLILQGELNKNYRNCYVLRDSNGDHQLTVLSSPKLSNNKQTQLQLNPRKWGSLGELACSLNEVVSFDSLMLSRLDFAVDVNIPLEEVHSKLIVKNKRLVQNYMDGEKLTGLMFGNKPEVFCIYSKDYQLRHGYGFKLKKNKIPIDEPITRFEVRKFGRKLRGVGIGNLDKFLFENPFSSIKLYDLKKQAEIMSKDKIKHQALAALTEHCGMHRLYKKLNKHSNYKRNTNRLIQESQLQEELFLKHKKELIKFLGGNNETSVRR